MTIRPEVSVILPFYNEERFLGEAVESVLAQTLPNWELILVDDGSTDDSTALAHSFVGRFQDRIRYVDHPGHSNRRLAASRNLGVAHARAELIALLDADDAWKPGKLEQQTALMRDHREVGMIVGASEYWRSWNGGVDEILRPSDAAGVGVVHPPRLLRTLYPLANGAAPCPSDLLIRRSVLEEVGGFVEEFGLRPEYQAYEDQAFLVKVYLDYPIWIDNRCWDRYRIGRGDSLVSALDEAADYRRVRGFFLTWFVQYLQRRRPLPLPLLGRVHLARLSNRLPRVERAVRRVAAAVADSFGNGAN